MRRTSTVWKKRAFAVAAALLVAGCATRGQIDAMPGLADVSPTGPAGRKCYEFCAQSQANCKHMCPEGDSGAPYECIDDCITEAKFCLKNCPELKVH